MKKWGFLSLLVFFAAASSACDPNAAPADETEILPLNADAGPPPTVVVDSLPESFSGAFALAVSDAVSHQIIVTPSGFSSLACGAECEEGSLHFEDLQPAGERSFRYESRRCVGSVALDELGGLLLTAEPNSDADVAFCRGFQGRAAPAEGTGGVSAPPLPTSDPVVEGTGALGATLPEGSEPLAGSHQNDAFPSELTWRLRLDLTQLETGLGLAPALDEVLSELLDDELGFDVDGGLLSTAISHAVDVSRPLEVAAWGLGPFEAVRPWVRWVVDGEAPPDGVAAEADAIAAAETMAARHALAPQLAVRLVVRAVVPVTTSTPLLMALRDQFEPFHGVALSGVIGIFLVDSDAELNIMVVRETGRDVVIDVLLGLDAPSEAMALLPPLVFEPAANAIEVAEGAVLSLTTSTRRTIDLNWTLELQRVSHEVEVLRQLGELPPAGANAIFEERGRSLNAVASLIEPDGEPRTIAAHYGSAGANFIRYGEPSLGPSQRLFRIALDEVSIIQWPLGIFEGSDTEWLAGRDADVFALASVAAIVQRSGWAAQVAHPNVPSMLLRAFARSTPPEFLEYLKAGPARVSALLMVLDDDGESSAWGLVLGEPIPITQASRVVSCLRTGQVGDLCPPFLAIFGSPTALDPEPNRAGLSDWLYLISDRDRAIVVWLGRDSEMLRRIAAATVVEGEGSARMILDPELFGEADELEWVLERLSADGPLEITLHQGAWHLPSSW